MAYDHIIIGGGAAGCVLAGRLSEDRDAKVLLIEAGGWDWNPLLRIPLMTGILLRQSWHNWNYRTEPEPNLNNRQLNWPRGKVVGGSAAINGMLYVRGQPIDFNTWAQEGLLDWSYERVLPYFERIENVHGIPGETRGHSGPIDITTPEDDNPLFAAYLEAGRTMGLPLNRDYNDGDQEGVNRTQFMIHKGRRSAVADGYLRPALRRKNVDVRVRTRILKLVIENGRAVGVDVVHGGKVERIHCDGEIILTAGSISSPTILMHSGIGDPDELARHGIASTVPLRGVGKNMQDHLLVRVQSECTQPLTLHNLSRVDRAAWALVRAVVFRTGPAASFPLLVGAFFKSDPSKDTPDIQSQFVPGLSTASVKVPFARLPNNAFDGHAFLVNAYPLRPQSRGQITLRNDDPLAAPVIRGNYLSAPGDLVAMRNAVRILREMLAQPAFDPYRGRELSPGPAVRSDAEIDAFIRNTAESAFHPTGTCRMGLRDDAVVGPDLKVVGVEGLRVADASIMPNVTSGNTQAPTMMIAEKAADLIRGRASPSPRDA